MYKQFNLTDFIKNFKFNNGEWFTGSSEKVFSVPLHPMLILW